MPPHFASPVPPGAARTYSVEIQTETAFEGLKYAPAGVGYVQITATENFTDTSRGSQIELWSTINGTNTVTQIATFNGAYANFAGQLTATNLTVTGNVTAQNFVGNVSISNLTTNNVTANNIYLPNTTINNGVVTTANIQAGYIIANTSLISGAISISNNNIYSTNTAQDINFGQLSATANINFNRVSIFNKDPYVSGNIVVSNIVTSNGHVIQGSGLYQYTTSNNATVTQLTSKSTAVTANGRTGQITTSNASLAKGTGVSFTVNNNQVISTKDVIMVCIASGGTLNSYQVCVDSISVGSFSICITNNGTGALAEALIINFAILRVN